MASNLCPTTRRIDLDYVTSGVIKICIKNFKYDVDATIIRGARGNRAYRWREIRRTFVQYVIRATYLHIY